jgi:hypothetical protein
LIISPTSQSEVQILLRAFCLTIPCVFLFQTATADPLDDLFAAAQAGDSTAVEALIDGAETPQLRRDMMWALAASHPDTRAFTKSWADAEPDNPVALTARAWSLYREGFIIRGVASVRDTWPASYATARPMIAESYELAERALALDDTYLPASDAVIMIGEVSGHMDRSAEEAARILDLNLNRHSLVIAASSVRPNWLGTIAVKTDLCDAYAEKLRDAPGYTAEMCVIDAIFKSNLCCDDQKTWALDRLGDYIEEPLMEETVLQAAATHSLTPEQADRLRAKLIAEDRLTVKVAVSGRPADLWQPYAAGTPGMADFDAIKAALKRELAAALVAADRDPGDPATVRQVGYYYEIATQLELRDVGYYEIPPPADIEAKYFAVMDQKKLYDADKKARAFRLLKAAPRNLDALDLAATTIDDHLPDPLQSAIWTHALYTNAIAYSNYRYDIVGGYLLGTKFDRSSLEGRSKAGRAPKYSEAELTEAFDCPYVRALRLFDAACDAADLDQKTCYQNVGLSRESEYTAEDSTFVRVQSEGTCVTEREGSLESLRYEEIDLGL